jgi:ribosomal protein L36
MRAGFEMAQSKDVTATVFSTDARVPCMFTEHYVRLGHLLQRCASNQARCRRCNVRLRVTTSASSGCTKCKDVRRQIKVTVVCW